MILYFKSRNFYSLFLTFFVKKFSKKPIITEANFDKVLNFVKVVEDVIARNEERITK